MLDKLQFHYDFISPNAYFVHKVLPEIEFRNDVQFQYFPISLIGVFEKTNNKPTPVVLQGVKNKPAYLMLEISRFVEKHNLTSYKWNEYFPFMTAHALLGAIAAEQEGIAAKYTDAVFTGIWEKNLNLGDLEVFRSSLDAAGLPGQQLADAAQNTSLQALLEQNTEESVAHGVFGAPSIFVDENLYFGKDRLLDVENDIKRLVNTI